MAQKLPMAPCGIDCNECNLYKAGFDKESAAALVPWFRQMGWITPDGGAAEVAAKAPFCMGCLGDRSVQWSENCEIRSCCTDEKGLRHCGECPGFVCENLKKWGEGFEHHASALKHLEKIKKGESGNDT